LIAHSDSDKETSANFYPNGGDDVLLFNGDGTATIYSLGCANLQVYYAETANYLAAYAYTNVCGYPGIIPPAAFNDNVTLTAYPAQNTSISPLSNDEAHTGSLKATGIDLDPNTAGIQRSFYSPAVGTFEVDTVSGIVNYTPFPAFVGEGSINYVVYDSKNSKSNVAKILINLPLSSVPAMRATELFTPNNDGLNDAFVIGNMILNRENQLKIFDRNGAELFAKKNYNNDWYGELSDGRQAENGIYYYTLIETGNGGETRELKGSVELKR